MILPCPENPRSWADRPVTWVLVLLNISIYFIFFFGAPERKLPELMKEQHLETAGRVFLQQIPTLGEAAQKDLPDWIFEASSWKKSDLQLVGYYAIRQQGFLNEVLNFQGLGDSVAIAALKQAVGKFQRELPEDRLHRFGLSPLREQSFAWLTYQFSHVGFLHLASNLVFLLFMGWAIEGLFGGLSLLLLYLVGGLAGGMAFLSLYPEGVVPMVGASGSVSALIAFYAIAEPKLRIRFYYLLFPTPGLHGFIWLPTMLILPFFLVTDLSSLLSAPKGLMTGVAYSAHLGGAAFGLTAALIIRALQHTSLFKQQKK